MHSKAFRAVLNLLVIVSMLLPSLATPAQAATLTSRFPESTRSVLPPSGIFRARMPITPTHDPERLEKLGVIVLGQDAHSALVLVDAAQLEKLARLGWRPQDTNELGLLLSAQGQRRKWLLESLYPLLEKGAIWFDLYEQVHGRSIKAESVPPAQIESAYAELRSAMESLTTEQAAGISSSSSVDDDGDGLTNTQEDWWCTDPMNTDSDGDGASDGQEVQDAKDWIANITASYPSTGKPFVGWPSDHEGCWDDDQDSIPDMAERWELGLNMNRESTDRDKFDDGQELFGNTYCPGSGGYCGYGALPRNEDWGVIFAEMPSWVESPGNHPLAAAYPIPEVDIVESSLHVETVTTVTTDHTTQEGTEKAYSTAKTEGVSSSVSDTETWNEWQEVIQTKTTTGNSIENPNLFPNSSESESVLPAVAGFLAAYAAGEIINCIGQYTFQNQECWQVTAIKKGTGWIQSYLLGESQEASFTENQSQDVLFKSQQCNISDWSSPGPYCPANTIHSPSEQEAMERRVPVTAPQERLPQVGGLQLKQSGQQGPAFLQPSIPLGYPVYGPIYSTSNSKGSSRGGERTTTHSEYEEHTNTTTEKFSNSESWSTATAVDSSHAADLWFTYKVRNSGTEYAREICDLAFNIYIGDDPNPAYTYFVGNDIGGDGCFNNFMPEDEHEYTSQRIPLTLEQMKAIDLGGPVRIVVEDFSYGIDELFYEDASNSGIQFVIEDGTEDGDEAMDSYLIPTWGDETVYDVLARYFPNETDEDGNLIAIWTPEYNRSDTPDWCIEPKDVGTGNDRILWCKHALSTADWWNIYTNGMGDGSQGFQDTPASGGSVALFRFNKDTDLDGYSDRSEDRLGTNPNDPFDFPRPELIAGVHSIRAGDHVTATLSLLNTGLYDAYGVEAVMIAPNNTISITNNTVGGSGRVRAQKQVIVGSRILLEDPLPTPWTQNGHATPAVAGYYTGQTDRTYTFTVNGCSVNPACTVGNDSWTLDWDDGTGESGSLHFDSGYASPTFLDVGSYGLTLALYSGEVNNGDTFTVEARTPRDTFRYDILSEPYTEPIVIVSYNDPQGNHRFIIPPEAMSLSAPTDDLVPFSGQMLEDAGVEIVTTQPFTDTDPGPYSLDLVVYNPTETALDEAHLFLDFINISGTVVSEVPVTVTLPAGPSVETISWDTADFDPPYESDEDYIVMAFLTDYQGNILDTAARPLSSFQSDPRPRFSMTQNAVWDFGTAQQGTVLKRSFVFANVGFTEMRTHLDGGQGLSVETPPSNNLMPGDTATYTVTLNTEGLSVGPYQETLTIRTNDPEHPTETITVQGEITERPCDGFLGEYFDNQDLSGAPVLTRCDGLLDFDWGSGSPDPSIPSDHISARWSRQFSVYEAGVYNFETRSDDGVRVYVDDQLVIDDWENQGFLFASGSLNLSAGVHDLRVEWYENTGSAAIRLVYGPENMHMQPLDWDAYIEGSHNQGEWVEFTHTLGPDPQTLHPVKVYSADYGRFWGVGKYATDFGQGTAPGDMFGDGRDGAMPSSGNLDNNNGVGIGSVSGNAGSTSVSVTDRHAVWRIEPGDVVLIHQTQGDGAGNWELNKAVSDFTGSGTFTLEEPLEHNYSSSGSNRAQIIRVPQYSSCNVTGTVTPLYAWDGTIGGIFAVMCASPMSLSGAIDASGKGFRGGTGNFCYDGKPGESVNGEGTGMDCNSPGGPALNPNAQGGGGGDGRASGGSGGGGGGHATPGSDGLTNNRDPEKGLGGGTGGNTTLSNMIFGGGGGGGGGGHDAKPGHPQTEAEWWAGGRGGNSGGIIFVSADEISISGAIKSNGENGTAGQYSSGGGGAGAGGAIFLRAKIVDINSSNVTSLGGSGGAASDGDADHGGAGGNGGKGRIRIEYCESVSGSTNPAASTAKIDCYIVEQIESDPYTSARLNLPESFSNGKHYQVQYGRRYVFSSSGEQTKTLRLPASMLDSATLDALISDAGSGTFTFKLDIGNDGTWDWQVSQSVSDHASFTSPDLSAAFNQYWADHGAALSGDQDVPVRVSVNKGAQVLLTNLRITPAGDKTRYVRLEARTYDTVNLTLIVRDGSGPLSLAADVGDDGTVNWTWNGDPAYPVQLTTENLAAAFNDYLSGQSGDVDVPVRFYLTPFATLTLDNVNAVPTGQPDAWLSDLQSDQSSPTEGAVVTLSATVHNDGDRETGPLTVSFYATPPDGYGEMYVGATLLDDVPAGGSASASIQWDTLGFTGDVPLRASVDPYGHVSEINEDNNETTGSLIILTRPDLHVSEINFSDNEPVDGESITVTMTVQNLGQTDANSFDLTLSDEDPNGNQTQLCVQSASVAAESTVQVACTWSAGNPGQHRVFVDVDSGDTVDESDEANNRTWENVYVGFAGPLLLDSGGNSDVAYDASSGYGYLNGEANTFCGTEPDQSTRSDYSGEVQYRFDHLLPGHYYHLDVTLYECDGLGRQEQILIDDNLFSETIDLSDGQPHELSFLLDPAFYADNTITVTVKELIGYDALISEINLHDIDYRYADAGGDNDPAYSTESTYGWLDGVVNTPWGTLPYQSRRIDLGDSDPDDDPDNELRYRFDNLDPSKRYQIHLTFYQGAGGLAQQSVMVDDIDPGISVELDGEQRVDTTFDVPAAAYDDGVIVVKITRTNASAGAFVNEIALEELTLGYAPAPDAVSDLSATLVDTGIQLSWTDVGGSVDHYEVWRSSTPYFTPGDAGTERIAPDVAPVPGGTVTYTDETSHIGNPDTNDYYVVLAINANGDASPLSAYVGGFDFGLVPGQ